MIDGKHQVMENSMWGKGDKKKVIVCVHKVLLLLSWKKRKRGNLFAVNYMLLKNNKDLCKICNWTFGFMS